MNPRANQWHWPCQPTLENETRKRLLLRRASQLGCEPLYLRRKLHSNLTTSPLDLNLQANQWHWPCQSTRKNETGRCCSFVALRNPASNGSTTPIESHHLSFALDGLLNGVVIFE